MTKQIELVNIKESLEILSKRMQNALRVMREEKPMLKTIKKTKQMRLDELIKYVWDNDIKNKRYRSNNGKSVMFLENGRLATYWNICVEDLFLVEIEEEITEETEFELLVEIYKDGKKYFSSTHYNFNLKQVIDCDTDSVYALIDGKLELIWEADHD